MLGPLLTRLGTDRLRAVATELAVPLPAGQANFAGGIASTIRDHFDDPRVLDSHLTPDDLRVIGESYTFETKAKWQAEHPGVDYDGMVRELLFRYVEIVEPKVRAEATRHVEHAARWPELASTANWKRAKDKATVASALARALGDGFEPARPAGALELPRVLHRPSGITFVAVPGGEYEMGISPAEKRALAAFAKKRGEEARMHVKDLGSSSAPAHGVSLPPLLCSESPLTAAQARATGWQGAAETTPVHDVVLVDARGAVDLVARAGGRLLTEAEWEHLARAGEQRLWLSGEAAPEDFVRAFLRGELLDDEAPLGVHGLAWSTWVDDAWAPSYRGAPTDGSARRPHELPEVVRGGGAPRSFPWQVGGEALLLATVHRDRAEKGDFPVVVARDVPARAG